MPLAAERMPDAEVPLALDDVIAAEARIDGHVAATPLLEQPLVNEALGFRLLVKAESLQLTGSFKVRGAFNQILLMDERERRRGVVALSSGNHAQGVAYAARTLSIPATIVLPKDAPAVKISRTRRLGAAIVAYDRQTADRDAIARELAEAKGSRLVHPYDDPRTIAGQGAIGLEIFRQAEAVGIAPDAIVIPCGGGGLAAGIALTRALYPKPPRVFTAEPAAFPEMRRSLREGHAIAGGKRSGSICDALSAASPGASTFRVLRDAEAEGLCVGDREVEAAMAIIASCFNLIVEPAGAIALACALAERTRFSGQNVVVIASGGNVDLDQFGAFLARGAASLEVAAAEGKPLFGLPHPL